MTRDIFRDRERGEEAAYFRQQDAMLIAKLRQKAQFSEIAHALAEKLHADFCGKALLIRRGHSRCLLLLSELTSVGTEVIEDDD